ncbi:MAG: ABC transporter substrate-binding protein [Acidimicrobiia bacterium]
MKIKTACALLALSATLIAACGGDDDGPTAAAASQTSPPATDVATTASNTTHGATTVEGTEPQVEGTDPQGEVATDVGVTDDEIKVGMFQDYSGPLTAIAVPGANGAKAFFARVNDEGGVCGRSITMIEEDTKYDPQVAVQAFRGRKDDLAFITNLLGTSSVFALSEDIAREGIGTIAGTLTAAVIPLEDVYVQQTPYALEVVNATAWAAENLAGSDGTLQIGIIYQGDPYGEEGLNALNYTADFMGNIDVVASASYAVADEDFTAQVSDMKGAGAEVVLMMATSRQTPRIMGAAKQLDYDATFIGTTATWASALTEPMRDLLANYRVVHSNTSWNEDTPQMSDLTATVTEYEPSQEPDNFVVTGWISAAVTVAALQRACDSGDLTRAGIVAAMEGLTVDLTGIGPGVATYGAGKIPTRAVRISEIDLETTFPSPITDYFVSDAAEAWTIADGEG